MNPVGKTLYESTGGVATLLGSLRARIRGYLWLRGAAILVLGLGVAFWTLIWLDWWLEPSSRWRAILLVATGVIGVVGLWFVALRGALGRLPDRAIAILLERKFARFREGLLTTVELEGQDAELGEFGREMLEHTRAETSRVSREVEPRQVLDPRPLRRWGLAAGLVSVSILAWALLAPKAFSFGVSRLALATDELWPRRSRLVVEGFVDGEAVVARGADFEIVVGADVAMEVPRSVYLRYVTADGAKGREPFERVGTAVTGEDAYQYFHHQFTSVLADREFDVFGGDARLEGLRLRVVDSPTIVSMILAVEYPAYTGKSPAEIPVAGVTRLPQGTKVVARCRANKELTLARMDYPRDKDTLVTQAATFTSGEGGRRDFEFTLPPLSADATLSFSLEDTDGLTNREPIRLALSVELDDPPLVNVRLEGIGSAITPLARIPLIGSITDKYGVADAAIESSVDGGAPLARAFANSPDSRADFPVTETFDVEGLKLQPGQKLAFAVLAHDSRSLPTGEKPNLGRGEPFVREVVTPEKLRAILEARELNLRQRLESIIEELSSARESLVKLELPSSAGESAPPAAEKTSGFRAPRRDPDAGPNAFVSQIEAPSAPSSDSPSDPVAKPPSTAQSEPAPLATTRADIVARGLLRLQRVGQNARKNSGETLGIALAFDDILAEFINNRVDNPELRSRLAEGISAPLKTIAGAMLDRFDLRLGELKTSLANEPSSEAARQKTIEQVDLILAALKAARDKMLELESFNEAIGLLRELIADQERVTERTRKERLKKIRDLSEDEPE